MVKIIGNTTATPNPRPDWNQTDKAKADYIKNKPDLSEISNYTYSEPLTKDVGHMLASNHPNGFDNIPIRDLITELLYPYREPIINSFSLSSTEGIKEKNVPLVVRSATVEVDRKSKSLASINLYEGDTLLEQKTIGVNAGGTFTFNIDKTLDGSTDTSYHIEVTEIGDDANTVSSVTKTYSFVDPYFYGVISFDDTVTSDTIMDFTKDIAAQGDKSYSYTTDNQCPVIAYPKSYGELGSIVDADGSVQNWTQSAIIVNGVEYYVYVGEATTAATTYNFNY